MTIIKSLYQNSDEHKGYKHRIHRSKKNRRKLSLNRLIKLKKQRMIDAEHKELLKKLTILETGP